MFTQCPECLTVYKLRADALAQARGRARCGTCAAEFDSLVCIVDELPGESFTSLKRRAAGTGVPQLTVPALRPQVDRPASDQRELFVDFDHTLRAQRDNPPAFARGRRAPESPRAGWGWTVGIVVVTLILVAQLAWIYRDKLLANAQIRAWVEQACVSLRCTIPTLEDRARIALMARDVRPHPSVPGALIITASMANNAEFAQTYPLVEITLSDVNEKRIAMRRFRPEEYVTDASNIRRGLAASATATLTLEVEDPGKDAVAFEFRFL